MHSFPVKKIDEAYIPPNLQKIVFFRMLLNSYFQEQRNSYIFKVYFQGIFSPFKTEKYSNLKPVIFNQSFPSHHLEAILFFSVVSWICFSRCYYDDILFTMFILETKFHQNFNFSVWMYCENLHIHVQLNIPKLV